MRRGFGAALLRIYRFVISVNDKIVDAVFYKRRLVFAAVKFLKVRFVFAKKQLRRAFAQKPVNARIRLL